MYVHWFDACCLCDKPEVEMVLYKSVNSDSSYDNQIFRWSGETSAEVEMCFR